MRNTNPDVRQGVPVQQAPPQRQEMDGPSGLDDIINQMNLKPEDIPDLDNVSLIVEIRIERVTFQV